jgi:hypothetical protein
MKQGLKYPLVLVALLLSPALFAQLPTNRIKPAVMYHEGDTIHSPRLGVQTRVPSGWAGVLPRDTEVFLLMPQNNTVGEIFVVVNEKMDLQRQANLWKTGFELSPGLTLAPDGELIKRGPDVIGTVAKLSGASTNTNQGRFYVEAKCSPNGFCIVYLASADKTTIDGVKKALQEFVDNTTFQAPSNESPYLRFDWKEFLKGKILMSMGYDDRSKRLDEVDLCGDGTFQSKITRTGIFKDQAEGYTGKKNGTWSVISKGEKATITFTFPKKLPPVDIELEARDEEVYIKGIRYFVGTSERCK